MMSSRSSTSTRPVSRPIWRTASPDILRHQLDFPSGQSPIERIAAFHQRFAMPRPCQNRRLANIQPPCNLSAQQADEIFHACP